MTEFVRWRHDDDPDNRVVRDLLHQARPSRSMTAAERQRTSRHIAHLAAVPSVLGILFWVKGLALGATLGAATIVVATVVVPALRGEPSPAIDAPRSRPALLRPVPTAVPVVQPIPSESTSVVPSAPTVASGKPLAASQNEPTQEVEPNPEKQGDTLEAETELLAAARRQVAVSPAQALVLVERHATQFPKGQMSIERELVAIEALQRLGRVGEAQARGQALLPRAHGSLYEQRLRTLLGEP